MIAKSETSENLQIMNGDSNITEVVDNSNNVENSNTTKEDYLKKEIEHLKQRLEDKEELITMLKKNQK